MDVLAVYHKEMKQAPWSNVKGFMALPANAVLPLPPLYRQPRGSGMVLTYIPSLQVPDWKVQSHTKRLFLLQEASALSFISCFQG